ncbi:MAG: hypothetical protein JW850_02430 [Thermoflexales bacterium]|nr:hypothetical protein [Thermoflexales bacterium]
MGQIKLNVPRSIEMLTDDERDRLLRSALRLAAKRRARELAKERREALTRIRRHEHKYGMSFAEFERNKLPVLDTLQAHEDYNDWFFWTSVLARAEQAVDVLEKMETVA